MLPCLEFGRAETASSIATVGSREVQRTIILIASTHLARSNVVHRLRVSAEHTEAD